jgi:hypothetical protein
MRLRFCDRPEHPPDCSDPHLHLLNVSWMLLRFLGHEILPLTSSHLATLSDFGSRTSCLELLNAIRRVPLELEDSTVTSTAIRIISKEICRSSCSASRNRLEVSLMQIVKATVQSSRLTGDELDAIRGILANRLRL